MHPLKTAMIKIQDKSFQPFIEEHEIEVRIKELGKLINDDYLDKIPLFVSVLNGAFMFASDLMKAINIPCEISFVKVSSYEDMHSTGNIKQLIGLNENILGRDIILIEDIVDSGRTISIIIEEFRSLGAKSVEIVTLLKKPESKFLKESVKYIGFEIPNRFVVGYGLDYNGLGRNYASIYQYIE